MTEIRQAAYRRVFQALPAGPPLLLMLDECANIAPLPDLPAMLSEAGGQGLQVVVVLQDLSQGRRRWPREADGMLSLFGARVDRDRMDLTALAGAPLRRSICVSALAVTRAAARYEFSMQTRRWGVWLIVAGLAALPLLANTDLADHRFSVRELVGDQVLFIMILAPIGVGALLADRVARDRRLGVEELLDSLPASFGARLWGKYLGVSTAIALPLALVWALGIARIIAERHDPAAIPLGMLAFFAVVLPGVLFVAAAALAFPTRLGAPLFRVLFVGILVLGQPRTLGRSIAGADDPHPAWLVCGQRPLTRLSLRAARPARLHDRHRAGDLRHRVARSRQHRPDARMRRSLIAVLQLLETRRPVAA